MSQLSPRLSLPYLQASQAQKHVTHNEALQRLDLLVQLVVEGIGVNTPPTLPQEGQIWALGAAPTGAWSGQPLALAAWINDAWEFIAPLPGWRAWVLDQAQLRLWTGSEWVLAIEAQLDGLPGLGIQTSHDSTNRLAVVSEASLFSHAGAGHQLKLNKAAPDQTASLLFQTDWSGRAEMGTAGSDDFEVKVSADGSNWLTALSIDRSTAQLLMPAGATINGALAGTAVTQNPLDTTAERLTRTGDFGLGLDGAVASSELPPGNDLDALRVSGFYRYDGSTTGKPAASAGTMLHLVRIGGNGVARHFQLHFGLAGPTPLGLRRMLADGSWSPWYQVWTGESLIGTVSQSGGLPTGAVIQRGTNANGEFTRHADGTQLCWHSLSSGTGGNTFWTYPASFVTAPQASATPVVDGAARIAGFSALGTSSLGFSIWNLAGARVAATTSLVAVGRWY